jgi:hypothetical protein
MDSQKSGGDLAVVDSPVSCYPIHFGILQADSSFAVSYYINLTTNSVLIQSAVIIIPLMTCHTTLPNTFTAVKESNALLLEAFECATLLDNLIPIDIEGVLKTRVERVF